MFCCFFGHRKIAITDSLVVCLSEVIENLILLGVDCFVFGSKSEFDSLCHFIVSDLKEKYPNLNRVAYTCQSESCTLESERKMREEMYSHIFKRDIKLRGFEKEFEHKKKYTACKASYVERNEAMIDNSDFVICYYNEDYLPPIRKRYKKDWAVYQPKSGTAIAYNYAKRKKKNIINIFELLK